MDREYKLILGNQAQSSSGVWVDLIRLRVPCLIPVRLDFLDIAEVGVAGLSLSFILILLWVLQGPADGEKPDFPYYGYTNQTDADHHPHRRRRGCHILLEPRFSTPFTR